MDTALGKVISETLESYTGNDPVELDRLIRAAERDRISIEVEFSVAHDSFPPLTPVNIPEYDSAEFCVLVENFKLDPEVINNWLIEKQEAGATIFSMTLHFAPKFDAWEVFIVYSESWGEEKDD